MQDAMRSIKSVRVQHKVLLIQVMVTLAAVLLAEGAAWGVAAVCPERAVWHNRLLISLGVAPITGLLLGAWASRSLVSRVDRLLKVSQAWLQGTLSLRIGDRSRDNVGLLAEQLDTLVEHLAQDEQDLALLREHDSQHTDQVRALAVDEERERLARELHDGVKQHLFSLSMTASALRVRIDAHDTVPEDVSEMACEVETTANTVQRTLTRLIEDLRPAPLQEQGLAAALNDYALLFGAREHILVHLDVEGDDTLLSPLVAEALYRVAQEALHNVARHARATRVNVRLRFLPQQVVLVLRDDGVGFDANEAHRGLGLGNMQDRIVSVGGRLQIDSSAGRGTWVRAEVRLVQPREAPPGIAKLGRVRSQPTIKHWAWLGQRLMIPVGQTWPWLPADQVHLRQPLIDPSQGWVSVRFYGGLADRRRYCVLSDQRGALLPRIRRYRWGYEWRSEGAKWTLRQAQGPRGAMRTVLMRNRQPLAAAQHQGRLLDTWSEILYDEHSYSLSCSAEVDGSCVLTDDGGETVLTVEGGSHPQIVLCRPVALDLVIMVALRVVDERVLADEVAETDP